MICTGLVSQNTSLQQSPEPPVSRHWENSGMMAIDSNAVKISKRTPSRWSVYFLKTSPGHSIWFSSIPRVLWPQSFFYLVFLHEDFFSFFCFVFVFNTHSYISLQSQRSYWRTLVKIDGQKIECII